MQKHPKILQLDSSGQPVEWIDWKKAVTHQFTGEVVWSVGEVEFSFTGGENRVTGITSVISTASIIAVRGTYSGKRKHKVPALTNDQLFKRDRCICAYCGNVFPEAKLSRDHVIPRSKGGPDVWTNVVTSCKKDNHKKSDKTLEQLGWKLLYVPYVPSHAESLIMKNRNVLFDQMQFLLSFVSDDSPLKQELLRQNPLLR